jgi:cytoskeleton protein RodZ
LTARLAGDSVEVVAVLRAGRLDAIDIEAAEAVMEASPGGLGERLRKAREGRGLTIAKLAEITKVPARTLQAVEREEFAHLPTGIYRRGYVRAYADAVGLDSAECSREYAARFEIQPEPAPPPDTRRSWSATLETWAELLDRVPRGGVAVVSACGLILALTFVLASMARDAGLSVDALPLLEARPTVPPQGTAAAWNPVAGAPQDPPALRLHLAVSAECWISAEADGRRVLYRVLEANEAIVIDASTSISLRIGNAGAITYSINDLPARRLGAPGQAISLNFTPENYDAVRTGDRLSLL